MKHNALCRNVIRHFDHDRIPFHSKNWRRWILPVGCNYQLLHAIRRREHVIHGPVVPHHGRLRLQNQQHQQYTSYSSMSSSLEKLHCSFVRFVTEWWMLMPVRENSSMNRLARGTSTPSALRWVGINLIEWYVHKIRSLRPSVYILQGIASKLVTMPLKNIPFSRVVDQIEYRFHLISGDLFQIAAFRSYSMNSLSSMVGLLTASSSWWTSQQGVDRNISTSSVGMPAKSIRSTLHPVLPCHLTLNSSGTYLLKQSAIYTTGRVLRSPCAFHVLPIL